MCERKRKREREREGDKDCGRGVNLVIYIDGEWRGEEAVEQDKSHTLHCARESQSCAARSDAQDGKWKDR